MIDGEVFWGGGADTAGMGGLFRSFNGIGVRLDSAAGIVEGKCGGGIRTESGGSWECGSGVVGSWGKVGKDLAAARAAGPCRSGGFL